MRKLGARFQATTPRERMLLAGLAAGGCLWALTASMDAAEGARQRYAEALLVVSALDARVAQAQRAQAADVVEARLSRYERWRFEGPNVETIAVQLEQRLATVAADAGLPAARIRVETPDPPLPGETFWLRASVESGLLWTPAFDFLDLVSSWPQAHEVVGVHMEVSQVGRGASPRPGRPIGQFRIDLRFPARISGGENAT